MESDIAERRPDATCVADVTLGERSLDGIGRAPDGEMGFAGTTRCFLNDSTTKVWQALDARKFAQNVSGIAARMAGDEYASVPLADRQRRGSVGMGRASAHGGVAGPGTAKTVDQGPELSCGSVANKGHGHRAQSPSPPRVPRSTQRRLLVQTSPRWTE